MANSNVALYKDRGWTMVGCEFMTFDFDFQIPWIFLFSGC